MPLLAIGFGLRSRLDLQRGLSAYLAGTLTAATFGYYQFAAAPLALPIPAGLAYDGVVDGRIGPISQAAYARFQAAEGEVADGFITLHSYEELAAASR